MKATDTEKWLKFWDFFDENLYLKLKTIKVVKNVNFVKEKTTKEKQQKKTIWD